MSKWQKNKTKEILRLEKLYEKLLIDSGVDVIKGQAQQDDIKVDKSSLFKAIMTVMLADVTMSLDNVISVAGAAKGHYFLLIFGLVLSIAMMAFMANLIAKWIKTYKWIAWVGLIAILIVAVELIYADVKLFF